MKSTWKFLYLRFYRMLCVTKKNQNTKQEMSNLNMCGVIWQFESTTLNNLAFDIQGIV